MKNFIKIFITIFLVTNINTQIFANETNAFSFKFPGSTGEEINMADYKGKTILMFAACTECGFRTQYKDAQKLYDEYKDKGLMVIGISSDDLNVKESRTGIEINNFCSDRFGTTYPISDIVKIKTSSKNTHPFFVWAETQKISIQKNFTKIIIDKNGNIVKMIDRETKPNSKRIKKIIDEII